jgi:hypothetical protein
MHRTDRSSPDRQPAVDRSLRGPSSFQRWLRSAALTVVVIAAALIANQAWIERQINEQIRIQIQQQIATAIPELIVQVGSVKRNGNHGIRLEDVQISLPASAAVSDRDDPSFGFSWTYGLCDITTAETVD